ncbi:MAG: LuxR C-terminal-related transcriptional regulator [Aeromonas sp.]|uniref:helix-turn-helix transcriptional regulator n=1 Tax=Aeromonas sp. TaxID=647 RepID=UPI002FCAA92A
MTHAAFTSALTDAVDALHGSVFPAALVRLIQQQVPFDCALLLGMERRPVYLYDNLSHQRELLFDRYLAGHFGQDPFMQALANGLEAGVWTLAEVSRGPLDPDYRQRFYQATGWQEEVGLILPIRPRLTLVLFLGRLGKRRALNQGERARLEALFPLLHSLCRQHWRQAEPLLAQSAAKVDQAKPDGAMLRQAIADGMASIGAELLTRRERQVATLLLQGLDTEAIADALAIGAGTVKNHRKHLYGKLRIGSQAELFGFFLNHLIMAPEPGTAQNPPSPAP